MNRGGLVMGWDIGGAHLKAAISREGHLIQTYCVATPVWTGIDVVKEAMARIFRDWPDIDQHRVTMTAELADVFSNRQQGVLALIDLAETSLTGDSIRYLSTEGLLYEASEARQRPNLIASANWVAAAKLAAKHFQSGVLVDVGSTTTDLTSFEFNDIIDAGMSDLQRVRRQSLIYQGVLRTPVCAWVHEIEFDGHVQRVAAEFFADAADVYRILGRLPDGIDLGDTSDGRGKSWVESCDRIARMLLTDTASHDRGQWLAVCEKMADLQRVRLQGAINSAVERCAESCDMLVGAGIGRFLLPAIASDIGLQYCELPTLDSDASDSLPAAALALWES